MTITPQPQEYIKRPIPLEVMQIDPDGQQPKKGTPSPNEISIAAISGWMMGNGFTRFTVTARNKDGALGLAIVTPEGKMHARPGWWVIRGVKREFYPCDPEIFAESYRPRHSPRPAGANDQHQRFAITFGRPGIRNGYVTVWAYSEAIARAWAHREYDRLWSGVYPWTDHIRDEATFFPSGELSVEVLGYEDERHV